MNNYNKKWIYLFILSIIWGSSYILIKKSLEGLTPLQVGSLRVVFTTLTLLIIGYPTIKKVPKKKWKWIILTGYIGSFFPSFLFAFAQTEIDSGITAILNSLTPLATLVIGLCFFKLIINKKQVSGIIIGLIGSGLLVLESSSINPEQNYFFVGLILLASTFYAISLNMLKAHLQDVSPVAIALGNFLCILPPSILVLFFSGFENINFSVKQVQISIVYVVILSIVGSAFAKIVFNKLVQISSPIFASSITYTLPVVALIWGVLDGEVMNINQILAALIILLGVYLSNKKPN